MLKHLLAFALGRRALVLAALAVFLVAGALACLRLDLDAYPGPAAPILEIVAQSPGQSAEEIERFVTIPIEVAVASTPGLRSVRSTSLYGLALVRAQFGAATDQAAALQQTISKLSGIGLPAGVQPTVAPANPTGEIYRYQLVGPPDMSALALKTLETWVVERRLKTVPGVRDVTGWGGPSKEYHVDVDLDRLAAYNLTLPQVLTAMGNANLNVGGRTLDVGEQSVTIRGIGLIDTIDDVRNIIITEAGGVPVTVRDVATVEIGAAPRVGIAGRDAQDDIVLGVVLIQPTEKTMTVVKRVEAEVARINTGGVLPRGVTLVPVYDRADLVQATLGTVLRNLAGGIVLIVAVLWLLLGSWRSAAIVAATIPCALLGAALVLALRGKPLDLLSIAPLDLGILVAGPALMVEAIVRRLQRADHAPAAETAPALRLRQILRAAAEIDRTIVVAVAITIAAFVPLLALPDPAGRIFDPMAQDYASALVGALIATVTVTPVLASILLPAHGTAPQGAVMRRLDRAYQQLLTMALHQRSRVLAGAGALGLVALATVPLLGSAPLPAPEEGNLWIRASLPTTISLDSGRKTVARIRAVLASFPEVATVVSQHGRPDDGSDAAGFSNAEFFVPLKPGAAKDKLIAAMRARLADAFLGVEFSVSQYIEDNVAEATSGVKGANAVKLFGSDLTTLEAAGSAIKSALAPVPGIADLGVVALLGQPSLLVKINRTESARYGLAPADVNAVVQTALAGATATSIYEGERRFPLVARLLPQYRDSVEAIRHIQIAVPNRNGPATYVPLSSIADIALGSGAAVIFRENNERYIPIRFGVRDRDVGGTVAAAQRAVATVALPPGYHVEWSGAFQQDTSWRLAAIVAASLIVIALPLYAWFNSAIKCLLALTPIAFAACGGVIALAVTGTPLGVAAAIGFVSLFGASAIGGMLLVTRYGELHQGGMDWFEAIRTAAETRLRPILLTALSACVGLLPAALSSGIGAQIARPLAIVTVGGMLLAPLLTLLVLPALASLLLPDAHDLERGAAAPDAAPAE